MKKIKNIDTIEHTWLGEILQPGNVFTLPEDIVINDEQLLIDILANNCSVYDNDILIDDELVAVKFILGDIIEITYNTLHTDTQGRIRMATSPEDHASTHENDGLDEINVEGLSGTLQDEQHIIVGEAVSAMGSLDNNNPLNHNRFQQTEINNLPEVQLSLNYDTHDNSNDPSTTQKQAMENANSPSSSNPFATINDGLVGPQGPQGPQGIQGIQGEQGTAGERGEGFNVDESVNVNEAKITDVESNSGASAEDIYTILVQEDARVNNTLPASLNGDMSGHLISWDGITWHDFGQMTGVTGPQGSDGSDGVDSRNWYDGAGVPVSSSLYVTGDYYLDNVSGDLYKFLGGTGIMSVSLIHDSGSNTCADAIMLKKGALEIVVDNLDGNCSLNGTWNQSSGSNPYGSNSMYSSSIGSSAEWNFNLPEAGSWTVRAWWTAFSSRTTTAEYTYSSDGGNHSVIKDQTINGGQWNDLGTHNFSVGSWSLIGNIKGPQGDNAPRSFQLDLVRSGAFSTSWIRLSENNIASNQSGWTPPFNCRVREVICTNRLDGSSGQTVELNAHYRSIDTSGNFASGDPIEWTCGNTGANLMYNELNSKRWGYDCTNENKEMITTRAYAFRMKRITGSNNIDDLKITILLEEV